MGIARALRRVKRQAKQGGLNALRSGLGEELRSRSVPGPLRGAARKIAAFIDPSSVARSAHKPGSSATIATSERTHTENLRPVPPEHANKLGSDLGEPPVSEPVAPAEDTAVDPRVVGATPVFNATPAEVEPVDATPSDIAPIDATPVTLDASALAEAAPVAAAAGVEAPERSDAADVPANEPAAPTSSDPTVGAQAASQGSGPKNKGGANKKQGNGNTAASTAEKEKLAPSEEAAKSAARSGPGAPKRPNHGGKTSKKKKK
jgi:hypothetical protein